MHISQQNESFKQVDVIRELRISDVNILSRRWMNGYAEDMHSLHESLQQVLKFLFQEAQF